MTFGKLIREVHYRNAEQNTRRREAQVVTAEAEVVGEDNTPAKQSFANTCSGGDQPVILSAKMGNEPGRKHG